MNAILMSAVLGALICYVLLFIVAPASLCREAGGLPVLSLGYVDCAQKHKAN